MTYKKQSIGYTIKQIKSFSDLIHNTSGRKKSDQFISDLHKKTLKGNPDRSTDYSAYLYLILQCRNYTIRREFNKKQTKLKTNVAYI